MFLFHFSPSSLLALSWMSCLRAVSTTGGITVVKRNIIWCWSALLCDVMSFYILFVGQQIKLMGSVLKLGWNSSSSLSTSLTVYPKKTKVRWQYQTSLFWEVNLKHSQFEALHLVHCLCKLTFVLQWVYFQTDDTGVWRLGCTIDQHSRLAILVYFPEQYWCSVVFQALCFCSWSSGWDLGTGVPSPCSSSPRP